MGMKLLEENKKETLQDINIKDDLHSVGGNINQCYHNGKQLGILYEARNRHAM